MSSKRWVVLGSLGDPDDGRWGVVGMAQAQTPAGAVAEVGLRSGRGLSEWPSLKAFCPDDLRASA